MPMRRLLFVVNETYFFMSHRLPVAKAAQAAGYEVHVAAPDDHVWAPADFTVDRLRDEGIAYHRIPLSRRGTNPVQDLRTFVAIWRLMRRLRPDIVHLLTIKPVLYGGIAARLVRLPALVAGVTGLGQAFTAPGLRAAILRRVVIVLYRLATAHGNARVIVQSTGDRDLLARSGAVAPQRLALIRGSGVDLDEFRPQAEADGTALVILPARLIWEKGIVEFVDAARALKAGGTTARFALVGNTSPTNPRAVPEATLRAWHEEGCVEWWGRREDMTAVMAQAHVVCLPTKYGEGVPKVLIEAAASGRAIVATDIPGCREIVQNGHNGILVPVGDAGALAAALQRVLTDDAMRRRMGAAGRELVLNGFGVGEVAAQTLAVYRDLLSPARTTA